MKVITISTCDCQDMNCNLATPKILCFMAENIHDMKTLVQCVLDTEEKTDEVIINNELANKFWNELNTQARIFNSGKELFDLVK